ncbi:MAG: cysteine desulfurase, partial [Chlamydiia bacterium]|nr:cysteine desulfurase [Chlamydiia bacterium]
FYSQEYATVHRGTYSKSIAATHHYHSARESIAEFINAATPSEIIFTRGTTASINLLAQALGRRGVREGDEILVTEMEHHSNLVPWQMLCQQHHLTLRWIPVLDSGDLDLGVYRELLSPRTALVAVTHVSNALGTLNPVQKITKAAHDVGALVLIDGAQAVPHLPVDVQAIDADFYAFSGHKMYGPTGVGVLYGKYQLLETLPPVDGGGDMVEEVFMDSSTYLAPPVKFEAGTPPIAEVIGLHAAVEFLNQVGYSEIQEWESELHRYARSRLREFSDLRILAEAPLSGKEAVLSFVHERHHPLDIATLLDLKGIAVRSGSLCAQPIIRRFGVEGVVRVSLAFYNTKQEIDRFITALKEAFKQLSGSKR